MNTKNLTLDNFESTLLDNAIVLVDFWAAWCGPCRAFAPVFDRSARAHPDIIHAKVDTQSELDLAAALEIHSIPTVMAFRDGVLVYSTPRGHATGCARDPHRQRACKLITRRFHGAPGMRL